jgi:hypothetical protein
MSCYRCIKRERRVGVTAPSDLGCTPRQPSDRLVVDLIALALSARPSWASSDGLLGDIAALVNATGRPHPGLGDPGRYRERLAAFSHRDADPIRPTGHRVLDELLACLVDRGHDPTVIARRLDRLDPDGFWQEYLGPAANALEALLDLPAEP